MEDFMSLVFSNDDRTNGINNSNKNMCEGLFKDECAKPPPRPGIYNKF